MICELELSFTFVNLPFSNIFKPDFELFLFDDFFLKKTYSWLFTANEEITLLLNFTFDIFDL